MQPTIPPRTMQEPRVSIRCWAERLESGRFLGRATVTVRGDDGVKQHAVVCANIRDSEDEAQTDADVEVLRRFLAQASFS